jgi:hypothetical protein
MATGTRLLRHEPLDDRSFALEGITGPFAFTITSGARRCLDVERLDAEQTMSLIARSPSPVCTVAQAWRSGDPADWAWLGHLLQEPDTNRLRRARANALLQRERAPRRHSRTAGA